MGQQDLVASMVVRLGEQASHIEKLQHALAERNEYAKGLEEDLQHAISQFERIAIVSK